ncbi:uncharacterized protein LOC129615440 [Condylostylus longicornis]|uniref:uncharacterized protein LOC129615440 n=1 Tax=Condylostylus longicornis TaxID=2530218 RepID=UPI00244E5B11|nr:uncharacterized protein LOC129615440 [Condylostylus longicornis]
MCKIEGFDAQFKTQINGKSVEFVCKEFENKLFIIVTEYTNICNLYTVKYDEKNPLAMGGISTTPISIIHNFGTDSIEVRSAIEFLVNKTKLCSYDKEILVNIGLKTINGPILKEIAVVVDKYLLQ